MTLHCAACAEPLATGARPFLVLGPSVARTCSHACARRARRDRAQRCRPLIRCAACRESFRLVVVVVVLARHAHAFDLIRHVVEDVSLLAPAASLFPQPLSWPWGTPVRNVPPPLKIKAG